MSLNGHQITETAALVLPIRNKFGSRDEFVAAVTDSFSNLNHMYETEPVLLSHPEWTHKNLGKTVFYVTLPISLAKSGVYVHALSSVVKNVIERRKMILRIARVETDDKWFVWVETD